MHRHKKDSSGQRAALRKVPPLIEDLEEAKKIEQLKKLTVPTLARILDVVYDRCKHPCLQVEILSVDTHLPGYIPEKQFVEEVVTSCFNGGGAFGVLDGWRSSELPVHLKDELQQLFSAGSSQLQQLVLPRGVISLTAALSLISVMVYHCFFLHTINLSIAQRVLLST